jgi:two-component system sensor histidine kinase BarA
VRKRIVLVEDEPASRELLCVWLGRQGFEAECVADLASAKAALSRATPDAVLLDIDLGGECGLDLTAWMRRQETLFRVPVIAVTGHAMASDREFILKSGCNDYVPKPMDFARLRECLQRWLNPAEPARV